MWAYHHVHPSMYLRPLTLHIHTYPRTAMAGDVNLFLNDPDNDLSIAEIEVMIAEPACRRRGLGKEAIIMMMCYGM